MKYTGKINIDENENKDSILENPTMEFKGIYIEALYTDKKGNKHSRLEPLDLDKTDLKNIDIDSGIKKHKILKQFN